MSRRHVPILMPSARGLHWSLATQELSSEFCSFDATIECIVDALATHIKPGTELILLTPSAWWQVFHLIYPKLSKSKAMKALAFDAEPLCPIPIDQLEFAQPCGQEPGKPTVLVGLDIERARPLVAGLREAGYRVRGVAPLTAAIAESAIEHEGGNSTVSVSALGRVETIEFAGSTIRSWRNLPSNGSAESDETYEVCVVPTEDDSTESSTEWISFSAEVLCSNAATCSTIIPTERIISELSHGRSLQKWSTTAALVGICLLLVSFGLYRRAAQLDAATRTESAIQRAEYVALHPNTPAPTVVIDRLSSEFRSLTQSPVTTTSDRQRMLQRYRDTMLRLPTDLSAGIDRFRFDNTSTTLAGTTDSHRNADRLGQSVSTSAIVKTSSSGGRIQYEIRLESGGRP